MFILDFKKLLGKFGYLKLLLALLGLASFYYVGFIIGMPRDVLSKVGFELYVSLTSSFVFALFVAYVLAKVVHSHFCLFFNIMKFGDDNPIPTKAMYLMYFFVLLTFICTLSFINFKGLLYLVLFSVICLTLFFVFFVFYRQAKNDKYTDREKNYIINLITFCLATSSLFMGFWKFEIMMEDQVDLEFNNKFYESVSVLSERDGFVFGYSHENKNYILMRDSHVLYFD